MCLHARTTGLMDSSGALLCRCQVSSSAPGASLLPHQSRRRRRRRPPGTRHWRPGHDAVSGLLGNPHPRHPVQECIHLQGKGTHSAAATSMSGPAALPSHQCQPAASLRQPLSAALLPRTHLIHGFLERHVGGLVVKKPNTVMKGRAMSHSTSTLVHTGDAPSCCSL